MLIEYRSVESLVPYARNSRAHSDEQVAQIMAAMVEFGWTNPVLRLPAQVGQVNAVLHM